MSRSARLAEKANKGIQAIVSRNHYAICKALGLSEKTSRRAEGAAERLREPAAGRPKL